MNRKRSLTVAVADLIVVVGVLTATAYLVIREPVPVEQDQIPTNWSTDLAFVVCFGVVCGLIWAARRSRGPRSSVLRSGGYLAGIFLSLMAVARIQLALTDRRPDLAWPPPHDHLAASAPDSLSSLQQAAWALRLTLHSLGPDWDSTMVGEIPADWPYPDGVELAVQPVAAGRVIWSRPSTDSASCHVLVSRDATPDSAAVPSCGASRLSPRGLDFRAPRRTEVPVPVRVDTARVGGWRQHRFDAARRGAIDARDTIANNQGWHLRLPTPFRASASAAEGVLLVGGHGTGLVSAIDQATGLERWRVYAPNWVHQEPVTDGRTVLAGFGDNDLGFRGRAPAGVAAWDLRSGRRLWTVFDESSVMTSPIITDSLVVYATAAGILRVRELATGRLVREATLPGGVIMGPPLLVADTLVATLDVNQVCALLLPALERIWCRRLPGLRMVGHASATANNGEVVVTGVGTARTAGIRGILRLPLAARWQMVRSYFFPRYWDEVYAGQQFLALRLATGELRWASPLFTARQTVRGHTAGTATIAGGIGVVVLPVSDTLVGFDPLSGRVLWTTGAHGARGPVLLTDNRVVLAGRDGVLELLDARTGQIQCVRHRSIGWDRGGPILSRGLLYLAGLRGDVEAMPLSELTECETVYGGGGDPP